MLARRTVTARLVKEGERLRNWRSLRTRDGVAVARSRKHGRRRGWRWEAFVEGWGRHRCRSTSRAVAPLVVEPGVVGPDPARRSYYLHRFFFRKRRNRFVRPAVDTEEERVSA
uniref:Uncharacterized protein n=1 Tax=Oryza punctata TaxID=4537 RepID=A0A0E0K5W8_ORYPU